MPESADSPESLPDAAADLSIVIETPRGAVRGARAGTAGPPRLATIHLLVWTACCAVFLGIARSMAQQPAGLAGASILVLVAAGEGAGWAGLATSLARLVRGKPWPVEPGQWLLAILGAVNIVELLVLVGSRHGMKNQRAMVLVFTACALVLPLLSRRLPRIWRWFFGAASMLYALPLMISVLSSQLDLPMELIQAGSRLTLKRLNEIAALAALAVAFFDPDRSGHTWLHWTGIGTALWLAALSLVA